MGTFLEACLEGLDNRFNEVDMLIDLAEKFENENDIDKYNSICRSIHILQIAHFEGFLKECVKEIIRDINVYNRFEELNISLKKTFCEYFMLKNNSGTYDGKKENSQKGKLIEVFDNNNVKVRFEPFLTSDNKNPKATTIEMIAKKFGIKKIFELIHDSKYDDVFSSGLSKARVLKVDLKKCVIKAIKEYPYNIPLESYELKKTDNTPKKTFWEEFLERVLQNRHKIAHGNILTNPESLNDIKINREKLEIFIYLVLSILCYQTRGNVIEEI